MVFASTIAVYTEPLPAIVVDRTPFGPTMVYGAQKLMMEIALSNFQRCGWLDGVAICPSGVTRARQRAFENRLHEQGFYALKRGEDLELLVAPQSTTWLTSVDTISNNFSHAAFLSARDPGNERAFTLPALRLSFE